MARLRLLVFVVEVGSSHSRSCVVLGVVRPAGRSAYDFTLERTVSSQAFLDAVPPDWIAVRSRVPPPGGGPVFIATVPLPDPCRDVGESIICERLPQIMLPPGSVVIRVDNARRLAVRARW